MSAQTTLKSLCAVVSLGNIVRSRAGKTPDRGNASFWGGTTPWVTAKDLKTLRLVSSLEHITDDAVRKGAPIATPGDVLVLVRGMTLLKDVPIGLVQTPMSYNQDVRCLHPIDEVSGEYLAVLLTAARDRLLSVVTQAGHGTGRLDGDQLLATTLLMPPLETQQWVVDRIQPLESSIAALDSLIAAKRNLKRGMMEALLTGRQRMAEFHGLAWSESTIGDLFAERNETGYTRLRLLSVTADRGVIPREEVERKDTSNADKSKYQRVCVGDIAYNTMRMWQGVSALSDYEGIISPAYTVLVARGSMLARYARHLFKLPRLIHSFWRHSQGLVDDTLLLKYPSLAQIPVRYPADLAEQSRIADVLDCVAREIVLLEQVRAEYQNEKRAFLQHVLSGELVVPAACARELEDANA